MKPLFKQTSKKKKKPGVEESMDRVLNILLPQLSKIKYSISYQITDIMGKCVLYEIFPTNHPTDIIRVMPWVRSEVFFSKDIIKSLANYPRLNVHPLAKRLSSEGKIQYMLDIAEQLNLYFLVMIPKSNNLYWLQKYTDIPKKCWKLTYRKNPNNLDRIHLPVYSAFEFVSLTTLKKKLDKLVKL